MERARYSSRTRRPGSRDGWSARRGGARPARRGSPARASRGSSAPRQLRQGPLKIALVEAQPRQRLVDLGDHLVAAFVLEPVGERVVPVVQSRRVLPVGHLMLEPPELRFHRVEPREGPGGEIVQPLVLIGLEGLVDGGDADAVGLDELAAVRLLAPEGDAQERRLARSVAAHEADLLGRIVLPGDVPQDVLRAVALADAVESVQHAEILTGALRNARGSRRSGGRARAAPAARISDGGSER